MSNSKKKLVWLGIVLVVLVIAGLARLYISFMKVGSETSSRNLIDLAPQIESVVSEMRSVMPIEQEDHVISPKSEMASNFDPTVAQIEQHRIWEESNGYFKDSYNQYESINLASLKALTMSGDVGAIQYLANKTLTSNPTETISNYELAAVHGSTAALLFAADTVMLHDQDGGKLDIEDQEFAPPYRALIYALAAQLRGDNVGGPMKVRELFDKHNYTDAAIAAACVDANEKVDQLEARRISAGMNEFDNTVSPLGETFVKGDFAEEFCGDTK